MVALEVPVHFPDSRPLSRHQEFVVSEAEIIVTYPRIKEIFPQKLSPKSVLGCMRIFISFL